MKKLLLKRKLRLKKLQHWQKRSVWKPKKLREKDSDWRKRREQLKRQRESGLKKNRLKWKNNV